MPVFSRLILVAFLLVFSAAWTLLFAARRGDGRLEPTEVPPSALPADHDPGEPNGSLAEATPLIFLPTPEGGESATAIGMVDNWLDFDFFSLELRAGDSLCVALPGLDSLGSRLEPVLSLLDSTGAVLEHAESDTLVAFSAGYTGRYYILLTDRSFLLGRSFSGASDRGYNLVARRMNRRGDVDGDGVLTYRDAFVVFFLIHGILDTRDFTPAQLAAADFNGNGVLRGDIADFLGLLRAIAAVPVRSPESSGAKSTALASVAPGGWLLEFDDCSLVHLHEDGSVDIVTPGAEAIQMLALLGRIESRSVRPAAFSLEQNSPNPFNPSTSIGFSLTESGRVSLDVFDPRGRLVAVLRRGLLPAGNHAVVWDGVGIDGRVVASGVYFYRLSAPGVSLTRKMVLVK